MQIGHVTPNSKDNAIKSFCRMISQNSISLEVPVRPESKFKENYCYDNVRQMVCDFGGKMLLGWRIQLIPRLWIEAVHHAIWESNVGEKIDITPQPAKTILFLPDNSLQYCGYKIGEKYAAISNDPAIIEYIDLCNFESVNYISRTRSSEKPQIPNEFFQKQQSLRERIENTYKFDMERFEYVKK